LVEAAKVAFSNNMIRGIIIALKALLKKSEEKVEISLEADLEALDCKI